MRIQSILLLCSSTPLVWGAKCPQATGENVAQVIERNKAPTNPVTAIESKNSSAAPIGTRGAACMYCNEGKEKTPTTKPKNLARDDKYGAMSERATNPTNPGQHFLATQQPVCIEPPASDRPERKSISEVARDLIFPRDLIDKGSKVGIVLDKDEQKWTCYVGKYAPAGDAKNIAEITKYWTFKDPADPDKCTVEVGQVAQKDVSDNDIYESK
jgi:hypothetical protein